MKGSDAVHRRVSAAPAFVEIEGFARSWRELGFDDHELMHLQASIQAWPNRAPVIAGTGGVRKLRFASPRQGSGKRGGARVCYAYLEEFDTVLLIGAYAKVRKSDLTPDDKAALKGLLERAQRHYSQKSK
jgi:hypothetical protein